MFTRKLRPPLRLKGYDVISAHEVQKQSLSDRQQLAYAVSEGRAIFTFNAGDFDRLHKEQLGQGSKHYGILLSKQLPISETVKRLAKFLFSQSAEEITNNIYWI